MSYFEDGDTVPPPFNMIPTGKTFRKLLKCGDTGHSTRSFIVNDSYIRHYNFAYVTVKKRKTLTLGRALNRARTHIHTRRYHFQKKSREKAIARHDTVVRLLIRRYVTSEQRKRDEFGITEDDVREIRQDISCFRYDLIDILKKNGMRTPTLDKEETNSINIYYLRINT